jgi:hypothetical protein
MSFIAFSLWYFFDFLEIDVKPCVFSINLSHFCIFLLFEKINGKEKKEKRKKKKEKKEKRKKKKEKKIYKRLQVFGFTKHSRCDAYLSMSRHIPNVWSLLGHKLRSLSSTILPIVNCMNGKS